MWITKIKCIKTIPPFIEGVEYSLDKRIAKNKLNDNDKQVIVIESETEDGLDYNCRLVPLDIVLKHFIPIS
jgi:hypothetical protein